MKEIKIDVLVVGGGPSGFAAALAAARAGVSCALVERNPMLGGMGTAALVNNFCPAHLDGTRLIIGGIFGELRQRLIDRKAIFSAPDDATYMMEMFHPEIYAECMQEMCEEAGVLLLFGAGMEQVFVEEKGLRVEVGEQILHARYAVDASGDAVLAAALGLQHSFGRASDHAVMPLSLCYEVGPIDVEALSRGLEYELQPHPVTGERNFCISNQGRTNEWIQEAKCKGELSIPRDHIAGVMNYPGAEDHATVNFSRVMIEDPTDPEQLAAARKEGERQAEEGAAFFRNYLPGFSNAFITRLGMRMGVRESRQITGLHVLTGEEARNCTQFEDVIAQCCYAIDIHDPDGEGTLLIPFAPGTHFDIPWRSLIPMSGPGNVVMAGRCISADQEAMSAFRVSPSVMAIGEAAGVTAALAAQASIPVAELTAAEVQTVLRATGGILE